MQQRYYDPVIGQGLSVDPVTAYDNGDMRFFNRYAYAFDNPYRFDDPDGRCPVCAGVGAIAGFFAGGAVGLASSGGDWRAGLAGAVGGAVGGAITGGTLGAGASAASVAAAGVTAGIMGELAAETTENAINHGADTDSYTYSPAKIAVSGVMGPVGAQTGGLVTEATKDVAGRLGSAVSSEAVMLVPNFATTVLVDQVTGSQNSGTKNSAAEVGKPVQTQKPSSTQKPPSPRKPDEQD